MTRIPFEPRFDCYACGPTNHVVAFGDVMFCAWCKPDWAVLAMKMNDSRQRNAYRV